MTRTLLGYDNRPVDTTREADKGRRATQFKTALDNMKILAEGGTLPPRQGRSGRGDGQGRGQQ
ncbi:MAG TPA: hypothetical protein VHY84_14130 [Bryobacteraceae bacterium]|jgi:hypothetical protein|nr:hypothetical protein [Bryobacteraceae bacterium]